MNIQLKGIHKRFGPVHANDDINLTFNEGRIVGILGENGAGKSTLMKILSGYQPADEGHIRINGDVVDYNGPLAAIDHGIGMLQQDPLDIPAFTVLENFMYGSGYGAFPNRRTAARDLHQYSEQFRFDLDPSTPIAALSIAQRQQLEIVRLLSQGVGTLILDEPTTGISAEQKSVLFDALRRLSKSDGMIVLLVSHKLEDVIALCDEVAVLRAGRIVGEREMPATSAELVTMMFGEEIKPQQRAIVDLSRSKDTLQMNDVTLANKRLTVSGFSFRVREREVVGFAGLDGSGQELVMRAAAGLERPLDGRVCIADADLTGRAYRDYLRAGVVFGASQSIRGLLLSTKAICSVSVNPAISPSSVRPAAPNT
ncbi:MAG: ATP-binding cassette domain-containing protein, partial [Chloroflexota bacterium]